MRTRTPDQHEAEYRWLKPSQVAEMIGVESVDTVRELIREGHLEAIDVSRSTRPSYRVSPAAVDAFLEQSRKRVATN